ncbi:MAG: 50S ribosomal protein L18 [Dehalococcoidia bacterium]|nr:50S ribosomal protein L18 [Dehalococcoidia bacterium]
MAKATKVLARKRRHNRVRRIVKGDQQRMRLSVFRSANHIYAQVIDDTRGHTVAAASDLEDELAKSLAGTPKTDRATVVGRTVAERAREKGVDLVVFDRGGFKYHGRVRALAEAAREAGLGF